MLGKLIKHDFRSLAKTLVPVEIAVICASLIAAGSIALNMRWTSRLPSGSVVYAAVEMLLTTIPIILILGIIASSFIVALLIFRRFYKNLICDEGYLSFTLPVTPARHIWSKLITALIWSDISAAVLVLCVFLFMLLGTSDSGVLNGNILKGLIDLFKEIGRSWTATYWLTAAEFAVLVIVGAANQILQVYLAIVIGSQVAKKHKVLAAIGFYFVINIVVSCVSSVIGILTAYGSSVTLEAWSAAGANGMFGFFQTAMLGYIALMAILGAAYFLLINLVFKKRLNLE